MIAWSAGPLPRRSKGSIHPEAGDLNMTHSLSTLHPKNLIALHFGRDNRKSVIMGKPSSVKNELFGRT